MKTKRVFSTVFAMALLVVTMSGCASTRTSESTGEYFDNATVTGKVKTAYATDPVVSLLHVHVNTFKGVVQLSGFVDTEAEKKKAEEIARSVNGVREVKNDLIVKK